MNIQETALSGVLLLTPQRHGDARGFFSESWNKRLLQEHGVDIDFVQDNHSLSEQVGTVRGLHFQMPPYTQVKLVRCGRGLIFDVAVDLRVNSKTFGKHVSVILSDKSENALFIPKGFAHGFMCLSENCIVSYKLTNYQNKKSEKTINWFDKDLNIYWPKKNPTTSKKDTLCLSFKEIKKILK
jgi:dTDP-4-dehydrorhamnose 3,5-epimerase